MKGMIFSTPMVQALLEGRKTMTRRVVKPQPTCGMVFDEIEVCPYVTDKSRASGERVAKGTYAIFVNMADDGYYGETFAYKSRYQTGDVLYVKEAWNAYPTHVRFIGEETFVEGKMYTYRADYALPHISLKWRSSIHMPKDAARIFLRVTDARVERVQHISFEHILKEGIRTSGKRTFRDAYVEEFVEAWDSINAKKPGCSWEDNPYVWVISFERVEKPEDDNHESNTRI